MSHQLQDQRRDAQSGNAKKLVVFLHGYGANGADLFGLADPLAPHLPDVVFRAPDAPQSCAVNPMGFQWFPIPWIDGSSEAAAEAGMQESLKLLSSYLDRVLEEEGMLPRDLLLFGFSQGTMMSLHHAYRRDSAIAGVVGFSGRLMNPASLAEEITIRPPALLLHGDQDDVVSFDSLAEAENTLTGLGVAVLSHVMRGTGHGISPDGLSAALGFMRERFGIGA